MKSVLSVVASCLWEEIEIMALTRILEGMRKHLRNGRVAAVVALCLALSGVVWWKLPPREPVYDGTPLRYWLSGYDATVSGRKKRPTQPRADEVIREIGTNTIPTLLSMLDERESALGLRLDVLARQQKIFKINWEYRHAYDDSYDAVKAFRVLGPQTVDLMPQLIKIYDKNLHPYSRQSIVAIVASSAPRAPETEAFLMQALADTNDFIVRMNAAVALGEIHAPASVAVPALIRALSDPENGVRYWAVVSLAEYGKEARAATPALKKVIEEEMANSGSISRRINLMATMDGVGPPWGWRYTFGNASALHAAMLTTFPPNQYDVFAVAKQALEKIDRNSQTTEGKQARE